MENKNMQDQQATTTPQANPPNQTTQATSPTDDLTFSLTIRNRKAVLFAEKVKAMSSLNDRGKFDVLPHHGNLISLIKEYITIYKTNGEKQTIPIQNGIIYVRKSEASCYIDLLTATTKEQKMQQPQEKQQA